MNKKIISALCFVVFLILSACSDTDPVTDRVYDVTYFQEYSNFRNSIVKACKENPEKYKNAENCKFAIKAISGDK